MERIFAFTDESGNFGYDFSKEGVTTHFIITAIIIKASDVALMEESVESIREKMFQTGEIKSSRIGKNHRQRVDTINRLLPLPFSIFSVVVDKRSIIGVGLRTSRPNFYKFLNNIVHQELKRTFSNLTIVADEIGGSDYMKSFSKYVAERQAPVNFYNESEFMFKNSHGNVLIQLADLMSGTLGFVYDHKKKSDDNPNYLKTLSPKISKIEMYPKTFENYLVNTSALAQDYHEKIAEICLKQSIDYISSHSDTEDDEVNAQIVVLEYMNFRFMNNNQRKYIPTKELMNQLTNTNLSGLSVQAFRNKIIAKLRDNGVIIASSPKGYKIPSRLEEVFDFINHGTSIIIPMLARLKKCRDLIKMGTLNEVDLFDNPEYSKLKQYFEHEND